MLDFDFIRNNKDAIKKAVKDKGLDLNVDRLLEVYEMRKRIIREVEELNSLKNDLNDLMKEVKTKKKKKEIIKKGKDIKKKSEESQKNLKNIEEEFEKIMVKVPIIPSPDTPVGKGETDNQEISRWGELPKFEFKIKNHVELGKILDILDLERGVKVAGFRGYYLKKEGALLAMALMQYAFTKMVEKGYLPMIPPTLVKEFALYGSGYFKGLEYNPETDEIYQVATSDKEVTGEKSKEKKFLVGTAEPSLLAYYAGETLDLEQLPMKICGFSPCYRSEIGSYSKDIKGIYRVHEFMKVEQVILCRADIKEAEKFQEEMVAISKEMHEELGIPYRQIIICTGDLSSGKYRQYDLEAWLPGMNRYGETGSASIFLDWQARRLKVKYKDKDGSKKFVYMLNNTALATPRTLIAILENFQQADGSVKIPVVLQKFIPGGASIISPVK